MRELDISEEEASQNAVNKHYQQSQSPHIEQARYAQNHRIQYFLKSLKALYKL